MTSIVNKTKALSPARIISCCILAFIASLSLRVHFEPGAGLDTGSFLADNLSKFANQFYHDGFADILIFGAVFLLIYLAAQERAPDRWTLALAVVFAAFYLIAMVCLSTGNFNFFFANSYQLCLTFLLLIGYAVLFYCALHLIYKLMEYRSEREEKPLRHPMRSAAIIIFLCWLPWLLSNYPCSFCPDATGQISQWLGRSEWSAHHPPFSTLLMGICVSLGDFIWDKNFGAFLYTLFQSISGAVIFAYMLSLLYQQGLSRRLWTILLVFFCTPFWAMFAQWFEKDFVYAQAFALFLSFLFPVINERKCSTANALRIGLAALAAILLRKTGSYELIAALLVIGLWLRQKDRLRFLASALAVIILSSCVNNILYPALGIKAGSVKEALSVPFQQTARYVNTFPDEVTEEERTAIDAVLVYDELDKYTPEISDSIKALYREDSEAFPAYIRHWFNMLLKHPVCYFEAGFMLSYGYFAPVRPSLDAYTLTEYYPSLGEMGFYRVFGDFPTKAFTSIREMFIQFPLTNLLCMAGLYTWILMACFVQLLRKKEYSALLLLIPGIMNVLISIASPLCASTRYELPVIAAIPLIIGYTILLSRKKTE